MEVHSIKPSSIQSSHQCQYSSINLAYFVVQKVKHRFACAKAVLMSSPLLPNAAVPAVFLWQKAPRIVALV